MKTKKVTTKKSISTKTNLVTSVPKTIREQLEQAFFRDVLEQPYKSIPQGNTLRDYVPGEHKEWIDEFVQMYMDNIYMRMNVQIPKTYAKKTVVEILDYLEKVKRGQIFHGWK